MVSKWATERNKWPLKHFMNCIVSKFQKFQRKSCLWSFNSLEEKRKTLVLEESILWRFIPVNGKEEEILKPFDLEKVNSESIFYLQKRAKKVPIQCQKRSSHFRVYSSKSLNFIFPPRNSWNFSKRKRKENNKKTET